MFSFILQRIMNFSLKGIVLVLGIPDIFYSLSVTWIITNLIILIILSSTTFNETVFNKVASCNEQQLGPSPEGRKFFQKLMSDFKSLARNIYRFLEWFTRYSGVMKLRS